MAETADKAAPMAEVRGRTAFITGGANGIGLGIARALVKAGANVVIADIRESSLAEAKASLGADDQVETVQLDVTDRAGFVRAADAAEARFGKIHMLIGNAGVGVMGPIVDTRYDDWDWARSVNIDPTRAVAAPGRWARAWGTNPHQLTSTFTTRDAPVA